MKFITNEAIVLLLFFLSLEKLGNTKDISLSIYHVLCDYKKQFVSSRNQ